MRYAFPLIFLASPALAHPGTHLHPHDVGYAAVMVGLSIIAAAAVAGFAARRVRK